MLHIRHRLVALAGALALAGGLALAPQATFAKEAAAGKSGESAKTAEVAKPAPAPDPRAGDKAFEQARKLLKAIDGLLEETAKERYDARRLPSKDEFLVTPIWTETREDRQDRIRELLDAVLGIVTDVPIVRMQKAMEARRKAISELKDDIARLHEKKLTAPKDGLLPGILTDTVESLDEKIKDLEKRIAENRAEIEKAKVEIHGALAKSGIEMPREQLDLLLDSVLSDDLIKLVATFNGARIIDEQLAAMLEATGDNLNAARKYFAMHAALFAMIVHAQGLLIEKIDTVYMPRMAAIERDIAKARRETKRLLRGPNREDQRRALRANLKSQDFARRVAQYYRNYLLKQREQIARARAKTIRDLRIADNTYETVEASFELRALIRDATAAFKALQTLETPGFDQIFKNKELRREFENLTRKLDVPTS